VLVGPPAQQLWGEFGAEVELVDVVGEGVAAWDRGVEVGVEVVDVHVAVAEAAAGRDVEVADHLVDAQAALDAAALPALGVESFAVAFSLALFDPLAFAEGPAVGGVGFAHVFARVAAAGFLRVGWRWCRVAGSTVLGIHVFGRIVWGMEVQGCAFDWMASF